MTTISESEATALSDYITDDAWGIGSLAFEVGPGGTIYIDILALDANGQLLAKAALDVWSAYTGINFTYGNYTRGVTPNAIIFDDEEEGAFAGPDNYSTSNTSNGADNTINASFVNVGYIDFSDGSRGDWIDYFGVTFDSYSFQTYLHEIGHALGLGHAGPYDGTATYGIDNQFAFDSWQMSIMSYFDQVTNTSIVADYALVVSPMVADILAVQKLYGTAGNLRTENTTYSADSWSSGLFGSNVAALYNSGLAGGPISMTVLDDGGIDTFDFSDDTENQEINLESGGISSTYGVVGNVIIFFDSVIENARAGSGNDKVMGNAVANSLYGNAGNDTIYGYGGNDKLYGGLGTDILYGGSGNDYMRAGGGAETFYGGSGLDYLSYSSSTAGVSMNLATGAISGGWAADDTIVGIESVGGSNYGDTIYGTSGANTISTYGGNDRIYSGSGNDKVYAGAGNDFVLAGGGAERYYGGSGSDTISYYNSGGVTLNLANNTASGSSASNDIVNGFENVIGSATGGDTIYGTSGNNSISTYGGNDRIYSGSGNDKVYAGAGNDFVLAGGGAERYYGGSGSDTISYYNSGGVTLNLANNTASGSSASNDIVNGFENVIGSATGGDTIYGTSGNNSISTYGGNDRIYSGSGNDRVYAGAGNDFVLAGGGAERYYGGSGSDTISYYNSGGVTLNLANNTASGSSASNDIVNGFENVIGSATGGDTIYGTSGNNTISTYGGNDRIYSGSGNDTVYAGAGNDFVLAGGGAEKYYGGSGSDTISYYNSGGVTLNLANNTASGSSASNDIVNGFENVIGSATGGDTIYGTSGANIIRTFGG